MTQPVKRRWAYQKLEWTDLSKEQREIFESIELDFMLLQRDLRPLLEATMSSTQIDNLFKGAEELSRQKNLRTGFGKAADLTKDVATKINNIMQKWGEKLKNSQPVQNADQKFRELKAKLRTKLGKDPRAAKALAAIDALGGMMQSRPYTQAAILGLLSFLTVASLGLGPVGIGITSGCLMAATEMIKGSDLSTSLGKGIKAGALGFIASGLAHSISNWFADLRMSAIQPVGPEELGISRFSFSGRRVWHTPGMQWTQHFSISDVTVDKAMRAHINDTILRMGSGDLGAYDTLLNLARKVSSASYQDELLQRIGGATQAKINNDGFLNSIITLGKFITNAAGAVAGAAGTKEPKQPVAEHSVPLSYPIMEGLWADITLKFGAGKLQKAWTQLGRPTDSVAIAQMLGSMGMDDETIREVFGKAGLSPEEINATMEDLSQADDESDLDIPFTVGDEKLDNEAKAILKKQGRDAFVRYWEEKLKELEAKATGVSPESKPAAATAMQDDVGIEDKIKAMLANKEQPNRWAEIKRTIQSAKSSLTNPEKFRLEKLLKDSDIDRRRKSDLLKALAESTVISTDEFYQISAILKENRIRWQDIGFQTLVKSTRTDSVILL